jgi:hypothetical protein
VSVSTTLPPPPAAVDEPGGGGWEWIELTTARHDIDASLLIGRLAGAGVEASTVKDRASPGAWLYAGSNPWAPVTVLVRRRQLEEARLVLAEISLGAPPAPRRASPGAGARPPAAWWVVAIGLGIVLGAVALGQASGLMRARGSEPGARPPAGEVRAF